MLTADELRKRMNYDSKTGVFTHKIQVPYSRIKVGAVAGCTMADGYRMITIAKQRYMAHRLAWLHTTGEWPDKQIDHVNGDRSDNRFVNLRQATGSENGQNQKLVKDSTTKLKGVCWNHHNRKYSARIFVSGKRILLGYFDCPIKAHAAYVAAAYYHFGDFARVA